MTHTSYADSFLLKRAIVTWDDGTVDDSAASSVFSLEGSMSIVGNTITQNIKYCYQQVCDDVVQNGIGTILYVNPNMAYVTIRREEDGVVDNLIIQSLTPNIITLYVYEDGTAEAHEWQPSSKNNKQLHADGEPRGSIARGIADALRAIRK